MCRSTPLAAVGWPPQTPLHDRRFHHCAKNGCPGEEEEAENDRSSFSNAAVSSWHRCYYVRGSAPFLLPPPPPPAARDGHDGGRGGVVGGRWPVGGVVVRGRRLARLSAAACCYLRHCGIQVLGHFPHALRHSPAEPSEPTCQCGHALRHCVHTESNRSRGDAPCRHCFWCTPPPWPMWCTGRCSPCSRCPAACASPPAGSRPHASCRPGGS